MDLLNKPWRLLIQTGSMLCFWGITISLQFSCQQQANNIDTMKTVLNRKPVVNGRFYPNNPDSLKSTLADFFGKQENPNKYQDIRALIVPHAGYVYSGQVAAKAYSQIDPNKLIKNIFILAPSHHHAFKGASIYNLGNYETPFGEVPVNISLADTLIASTPYLFYLPEAHTQEHSLEVQLPFLQYHFNQPFQIIPIVIGTHDQSALKSIAESLKPYFNQENLFVISSDFSHFPNYEDAQIADMNMADGIEKNKVDAVYKSLEINQKLNINNLATSACGVSGILTLLQLTENNENLKIKGIKYMNSGDIPLGDKDRVVGYWAFTVTKQPLGNIFILTDNDKNNLMELARQTLISHLNNKELPIISEKELNSGLESKCGVFVSLHTGKHLRGCIGRFESDEPLFKLVQKMAIAAATKDSRFNPVKADELEDIQIEISVLTPMKPISSKDEIEIGKHGIYIKKGYNHGTLLPQVAVNQNWSVEEFLGYCSQNKAGLGWEGWKTAEIYTYTALVFSE